VDRIGRGDEHGDPVEAVGRRGQTLEVERRLWQDRGSALPVGDLADHVGECGVGPGGHEVEGVAAVAADRPLAHVGTDEPHLALAVCAKRV